MKKTLVALTVAAFAASSAQALTVLDQDGTKVDFNGSLRLIMEKGSVKTTDIATRTSSKTSSSALRNAGSRFGVNVKHMLGEDFYALGRLEFRFDDTSSRDQFGSLYAKRAYVGLGSKQYGDVTFGRQVTIADDLNQADDYEYGIIPKGDYIPTSGTGVIRYDYKGIEGLQLSTNYNFGQQHNDKGRALSTNIKNGYAAGAIFARDAYDLRVAYGHTNYETGTDKTSRKDGYLASLGYTVGDLILTGDFGYAHEKNENTAVKTNKFYVSPGFQYQVIPASKVYGNYLYERSKTQENSEAAGKTKTHGFLLGVDYKFHKQVVAFVEGKYTRTKEYSANDNGYDYDSKTNDKAIGVGMRVFW